MEWRHQNTRKRRRGERADKSVACGENAPRGFVPLRLKYFREKVDADLREEKKLKPGSNSVGAGP
jgi:hypothetical protein